jgi:hypothetical protein
VTLQNEAFVFCLNEDESSGNARQHFAHAASDYLLETSISGSSFWSSAGSSEMAKTMLGELRFCNSRAMFSINSLSVGMARRYLGSKSVKWASWLVNL